MKYNAKVTEKHFYWSIVVGKEYVKAVCHPAYLAEYIIWNVRLDEAQAGI